MSTGVETTAADVELVLAFLNTVDVEQGTDLLDEETAWLAWLADRALTGGRVEGVRAVRTSLRGAVGDPDATAVTVGAPLRVELRAGVPRLIAAEVTAAVLAATSRLAVVGEWDRIKICPADDCRWAFYDRSRNRSRTWCSMRVCGNREKARAWRERTRTTP